MKAGEIPRDWFTRIEPSNRSPSPLFPGSVFTTQRIGRLGEPWWTATLSRAVRSRGLGWRVRWGEGGGWRRRAASLRHFCTASRWGKRTLICSMSRALCAKGASSLAGTRRLAVSPGPLNKACAISLWATGGEGNCSLCATSSTVLCWQKLVWACKLLRVMSCYCEPLNRRLWGKGLNNLITIKYIVSFTSSINGLTLYTSFYRSFFLWNLDESCLLLTNHLFSPLSFS